MIDIKIVEELKKSKNLLAFSAGIDSTALFFILKEHSIDFDCAIVNYHTRKNSDIEAEYAKKLCEAYGKKCYALDAAPLDNNFEANARKIRYDFFEKLIADFNYNALLTAHQLNDWLEWLIMQMCKGAGFFELCGMRYIEERSGYKLIRPLLKTGRDEIEQYIKKNSIKAFTDESNFDPKILRNRVRLDYAKSIAGENLDGIKKTFDFMQRDREKLEQKNIKRVSDLFIIDRLSIDAAHQVDLALKKLGVLATKNERALIENFVDFVASRKIAVCFNDDHIFIAPYIKAKMSKNFRDQCRKLRIPKMARSYIFTLFLQLDEPYKLLY